jgi:hypothetical protein
MCDLNRHSVNGIGTIELSAANLVTIATFAGMRAKPANAPHIAKNIAVRPMKCAQQAIRHLPLDGGVVQSVRQDVVS